MDLVTLSKVVGQVLAGIATSESAITALKSMNVDRQHFESVLRSDIFYRILEQDVVDTTQIIGLLSFLLQCSEAELCSGEYAVILLEEALDTQIISKCDELFTFLEVNRTTIAAKMGKGLILLRLCNELLRRLSKTDDTVFCGRILIFLSLAFPLSERSAVNLKGEFNIENTTTYDEEHVYGDGAVEEDTMLHGLDTNMLYSTFWSLQKFYNFPPELLNNSAAFAAFRMASTTVLEALKSLETSIRNNDLSVERKDMKVVEKSISSTQKHFMPKFLTSPKLLKLELADLSFRRHILLEHLVVLEYLLLHSSEAARTTSTIPNKSLQISITLTESDESWVRESRKLATTILRLGRYGRQFTDLSEIILKRDRDWNLWKCSNCQDYTKPAVSEETIELSKSKLAHLTALKKPYQYPVGNAVLSRLWSTAGAWSEPELKPSSYVLSTYVTNASLPSTEQFKTQVEAIDAEAAEAVQQEEIQALKDRRASLSWRALRSARCHGPVALDSRMALFKHVDSMPDSVSPSFKRAASEDMVLADKRIKVG